jgi:NAD(P)-dependent dehydrogenase (short-subunit alcohol dehydrogenase family)
VRDAAVRINVILPSTIDTPQNRASMPSADPTRWVTPDSIADVVTFLLSDASRDISGAVIPVYGNA